VAQVGRPKQALAADVPAVTRRVRKLVDQVHAGNLADAQRATGLPYPTLRDLYAGRTANPELATLDRLRAPYGVSLNWFTEPGSDTEVPLAGRLVLLPPHPRVPAGASGAGRTLRQVLLPYAARTLAGVFDRLQAWLERQAPAPERPVVGEATGDTFTFRLTTFLLQPLLAAEKLGEEVIPESVDGAWVERLEALGAMWRAALARILA
jgi:hypothetical protein